MVGCPPRGPAQIAERARHHDEGDPDQWVPRSFEER